METIKVNGMSCKHCVASVTKALEELAGITGVAIDLTSGKVSYTNAENIPLADIKKTITAIGFTPEA